MHVMKLVERCTQRNKPAKANGPMTCHLAPSKSIKALPLLSEAHRSSTKSGARWDSPAANPNQSENSAPVTLVGRTGNLEGQTPARWHTTHPPTTQAHRHPRTHTPTHPPTPTQAQPTQAPTNPPPPARPPAHPPTSPPAHSPTKPTDRPPPANPPANPTTHATKQPVNQPA